MTESTRDSAPTPLSLPENPNLDWLRKQAKRHLEQLRKMNPAAKLADAQFELATQYGFSSWRALKGQVDSLTINGQLVEAARNGDVGVLAAVIDKHPEKLYLRISPYDWTLLHIAAQKGQLAVVDLLLNRGLDVNAREAGDNTYAMHWAAAAGHLDVVRRLADAGGDVVGYGDDHELEVIGWATGWDGCDDAAHRAVADFLIGRGAKHHIFSAISANLPDEVRRIVVGDPSALNRHMSRNENHQMPLHFAVQKKRQAMVALLLGLGADPLAVDGSGYPAAAYATAPDIDRPVMERIRTMLLAEVDSAARAHRNSRIQMIDMVAALALGDWKLAARVMRDSPDVLNRGVLHLMAKRNDLAAAKWLVDHGADPNVRWAHWDSEVTPLHLAILGDHAQMVRLLVDAGADPTIRDSKHASDALGWADFFRRFEVVRIFKGEAKS
jgi:ankyrin repeat protein